MSYTPRTVFGKTGQVCCVAALLFAACGSSTKPQDLFSTILLTRHTDPGQALHKVADADSRRFPGEWAIRFRLLHADLLLEQNSLSEASRLLDFTNDGREIKPRLLAAQAYLALKNYDLKHAKSLNEEALAEGNQLNDPCWRSELLVHYAQTLIDLRVRDQADRVLEQAESQARNCSDRYWAAAVSFVRGNLYEKSFSYEQHLTWFKTCLDLAEQNNFKNLIAPARGNLALAYAELGDLDTAMSMLKQAESWYPQPNQRFDLAIDLAERGLVHHLRNEDSESVKDYERAIQIMMDLNQKNWYTRYVGELTTLLIDMRLPDQAERYIRLALKADAEIDPVILIAAELNEASILRMRGQLELALAQLRTMEPSMSELKGEQDGSVLWRFHSELAETLAAMGKRQTAEIEFKKAIDTAEEIREKIDDEWNRMTFSVYLQRLVALYINFDIERKAPPEDSLLLAEKFRAQMLAEKLHSGKAPVAEQFRKVAIEKNAVILSYWITSTASYVWATTAKGSKVFRLTANLETITREIQTYDAQIRGQRVPLDDPENSTVLYNALVAPAESQIPEGSNIIIVPDGPLADLNFETLIPPRKPLRFWLAEVSLEVSPSLAVLNNDGNLGKGPRQFLLIGGTIPRDLPQLPGSEREVRAIQSMFPSTLKVPLIGLAATPRRFLESKPGEFELLHISAHAIANKESPLDSAIMLTPESAGSDGKLYAHDLASLRLKADLVTLSTCGGAAGRRLPGEGLIGLTWALLSAGARNVVASLWNVSDYSTADFLIEFYRNLDAGQKPAQALHKAKVDLAAKSPMPYYWAAFQLYTR